jgi:RNA polymerase sigma factor (sigma-70 family)
VNTVRELVHRALQSDDAAFAEIVARFRRAAWVTAYSMLRDGALAEDAIQEAFAEAYGQLATLRDAAAFGGWLRRIVIKQADRARRKRASQEALTEVHSRIPSGEPDPERRAAMAELTTEVAGSLERLSELDQQVLLLAAAGESYAEMADFLVLPTSTIRKRLFDARRRIRGAVALRVPELAASWTETGRLRRESVHRKERPDMRKAQEIQAITPLLNVQDVEASMAFYRDALGFEVLHSWAPAGRVRWAQLKNGPVELMLNTSDNASKDDAAGQRRSASASFTEAVLYMRVPDADVLFVALEEQGFTVSELFDAEYGMREFHARDLDGYELAFISPLR